MFHLHKKLQKQIHDISKWNQERCALQLSYESEANASASQQTKSKKLWKNQEPEAYALHSKQFHSLYIICMSKPVY